MDFLLLLFWKMSIPKSIFRSGLKKISSIFLINNPPGELRHQAGPVSYPAEITGSVLEYFPWRSLQALKQI